MGQFPGGREGQFPAGATTSHAPWLRLFDLDPARPLGTFQLREEHLYTASPLDGIASLAFASALSGEEVVIEGLDDGTLPGVVRVLRACASGRGDVTALRRACDESAEGVLDALLDAGFVVERPAPVASPFADGITRLQHATLALRAPGVTLLTDPHFRGNPSFVVRSDAFVNETTAVLITHGHEDHWDLPSLMMFPRETTFIVPRVPRGSILSDSMAARLRSFGFVNVHEASWYGEAIRLGDVQVHALPFYGEQPTASEPSRNPDLRNWGNTYYVETSQFSAWILADAGHDHAGSMRDVATYVRRHLAAPSVVLSNMRSFSVGAGRSSPLYVALGAYWLALGADQIARFDRFASENLTLGPRGVAELCAISGARTVMPYAHWWGRPGDVPEGEPALLEQLTGSLRALGAATEVARWPLGASLSWAGERLVVADEPHPSLVT